MKNQYLEFVSDENLLKSIGNLYVSYEKAKANISKKSFFNNKVDVFKMTFDSKFNNQDAKELIEYEILRQVDKSINNSIGTFHEEILGGISGFQRGNLSGFDIKSDDDTLFADIKNKHNTMNSSSAEALFQKLKHYADSYKSANCYWVQILAKGSFNERWVAEINGKEYSHSRVFKISGDKFYELLTGDKKALFKLYDVLPKVIDDFKKINKISSSSRENTVITELQEEIATTKRSIIDQISFENFPYYSGFDEL